MITMKTASTTYYTIAIKYKHIKEVEYQDQERRHQEILNAIKQLDK